MLLPESLLIADSESELVSEVISYLGAVERGFCPATGIHKNPGGRTDAPLCFSATPLFFSFTALLLSLEDFSDIG